MNIGGIDLNTEVFSIAEIGANHNGSIERAERQIALARNAGASAVKFQAWSVDSLISRHFLSSQPNGSAILNEIAAHAIDADQVRRLKSYSDDLGILFSCSVFSKAEIDLMTELDVAFLKIASMDADHLELIEHAASTRIPLIVSTGLSTMSEIHAIDETLRTLDIKDYVILHCVSQYPPSDDAVDLLNITMLRNALPGRHIGFSDHCVGIDMSLAAVALGAVVIERHFTDDPGSEGWDHAMSSSPDEFADFVRRAKRIRSGLGRAERTLRPADYEKRKAFRRSLVAARPIVEGEIIAAADLDARRPGTGVPPALKPAIVGSRALRAYAESELIDAPNSAGGGAET